MKGQVEFQASIDDLLLVDHHVHGAWADDHDRPVFEQAINEASPEPVPPWMTQFDSQLGLAIRAHCAPLLDLEVHAPADVYWARRRALGEAEVTRRFLRGAGVADWVVDTGHGTAELLDPMQMASVGGGRGHEIIRIEAAAEDLGARGVTAAQFGAALAERLVDAARSCVAFKTVIAYRGGFEVDWSAPAPATVREAAARWIDAGPGRLTSSVLIRHGIHLALASGRPLQIHVGFGDRDLDLHRCNPMLLLDLLRQPATTRTPIMLLHCYPYHREAGYLSQAFTNVYCDVGLALNYVGARAPAVLAESLELAPFARVLYSSDAWGPAELHYLGAHLWRRGIGRVLGGGISDGSWSRADARRLTQMMAADNARRVYELA